MRHLFADVRHAARGLRHAPGFAVSTVLALTLGVGATTALFGVLWAVLIRPLPYHAPDRLVTILHGPTASAPVSPADYLDLRRHAHTVTDIAAAQAWGASLFADGRAERIPALQVSGTLFRVLGVTPSLGRAITEDDTAAGQGHVAVISNGLWRRAFDSDPNVIGRPVRLNGEPFTVVGVMPPTFRFAPFWQTQAELWVPLVLDARRMDRDGRSLRLFARLKDGVSLAQAQAEFTVLTTQLARDYPDTDERLTTGVTALSEKASGPLRPVVLAIFGLAGAVLLIACANVATLTLARVISRGRELGVRAALGAGRGQLARLLLCEGAIVGTLGALSGTALAWASLGALRRFLPPAALPPHADLSMSTPALAFGLIVALCSGLVATLLPLLHIGERALAEAVRDGRAPTGSPASRRTRATLVGIEVALAVVLLVAAGLLGRTLLALRQVDPGFNPRGAVALSVSLEGASEESTRNVPRFFTDVVSVLATLPGATAAGAINHLPLAGDLWSLSYVIDGQPAPRPGDEPHAAYRVITPGYFRAMAQAVLSGRDFDRRDDEAGAPVAIVNATLAHRWWPHGSAVGQRVAFNSQHAGDPPRTIVAVVSDVLQAGLTTTPMDEIYLPLAQRSETDPGHAAMTLVVRGGGDAPVALLPQVRDVVRRADAQAAVYDALTLDEVMDREVWRERLASNLTAAFAVVALLLAALGIQGIVSHAVSSRVREFGVRLALGATPASLPRLAMREALLPVLVGLGGGVVLAVAAGRLMTSLLVSVGAGDPLVFTAMVTTLAIASAVAAWRPAARIARLDPSAALRDQ